MTPHISSIAAPNKFLDIGGRKLAYRDIGAGTPILLCTRFRGNLDAWDPAFLDQLVAKGMRVITFDYTGLGLSTGEPTYNPFEMARDPIDLMTALELSRVVLAGWSLGGLVAQVVLTQAAARLSHLVLIGTAPPGPAVKLAEPLFFQLASRPVNTDDDEIGLFFEPKSESSRAAAKRSHDRIAMRTEGKSPPVPWKFAAATLPSAPQEVPFPALPILDVLKTTSIPLLHIGGDHDIIFPVENWYALNQQLPTLQLITFPSAGHGPQHQYPEAAADHISVFVNTIG